MKIYDVGQGLFYEIFKDTQCRNTSLYGVLGGFNDEVFVFHASTFKGFFLYLMLHMCIFNTAQSAYNNTHFM